MRALIFGVGGQDGSYLAELLLEEGSKVVGVARKPAREYPNLAGVVDHVVLGQGSAADPVFVSRAISIARPDEVYNFAAPSFVPPSWDSPVAAASSAHAAAVVLDAVVRHAPTARVLQASSSEIFGWQSVSRSVWASETSRLAPATPYGAAKAHAHLLVGAYRQRFGLHASSAILFNHESPRRRPEFVTRKLSIAAARVSLGLEHYVRLDGSLEARRDWGWAPDYVRAMRAMMLRDVPGDLVVATGELRSVGQLAEAAFQAVDLDWRNYVRAEAKRGDDLGRAGQARKARKELRWKPAVGFEEMIARMVEFDVERERRAA